MPAYLGLKPPEKYYILFYSFLLILYTDMQMHMACLLAIFNGRGVS